MGVPEDGATASEGKGFSSGIWDESSGVLQPLVNGGRKYKRLFIIKKIINKSTS